MHNRTNSTAAVVEAIKAEKINDDNISESLNWEIAGTKNTANVNPDNTEPVQFAAYKSVPPFRSFNIWDARGNKHPKKNADGNI